MVGHVPPPDQDIGLIDHALRQAVFRLVQRRRAHVEAARLTQMPCDHLVNPLGINLLHYLIILLVTKLVPNRDAYISHVSLSRLSRYRRVVITRSSTSLSPRTRENSSNSESMVCARRFSPLTSRTHCPSCIMIVRSPMARACSRLWVTMRVVSPCSFTTSAVILRISWAVRGSSAAVCSSNRRSLGLCQIAMRSESACLWPPERKRTRVCRRSSSPKPSFASSSRKRALSAADSANESLRRRPRAAAIAKFSSIVNMPAVPIIGS